MTPAVSRPRPTSRARRCRNGLRVSARAPTWSRSNATIVTGAADTESSEAESLGAGGGGQPGVHLYQNRHQLFTVDQVAEILGINRDNGV
jgi:hypothetical protein